MPDIAGIAVLGDDLEGYLFAATTDEQGNVRFLRSLWLVNSASYRIILALKYGLVLCPHCQDDLYCLTKLAETYRCIRIIIAIGSILMLIPTCTNAEIQAAMGKHINCTCHFRQ